MAYNRTNYCKDCKRILDIYNSVKEADIPDTFILRNIFPKAGIFISYRKWMYIKGMKPSELGVEPENDISQLKLFA